MYNASSIRNICLLGHSGSGKSALAESLLYMTGAIDRMGKNADGNTVADYDPEEIRRNISISTSVIPVEYSKCKINVLDTPGAFDFSGAVAEALRAADAAILVASAKDGITVGFEKAWKYCEQRKMPRFIYISKLDEDNSDFNATLNAMREKYGTKIAPIVVPLFDGGKKVSGLIDVLPRKAYGIQNFKRTDIALPAEKEAVVDEFTEALKEAVAETDEALMDKFFDGEDFTYEEMVTGLKQGVADLSVVPVVCGSATSCLGTLTLLDNVISLIPAPQVAEGGAFVWKTVSDQYGKYSYIKVLGGEITSDTVLVNARTGETEKLGRLYTMCGKKATEVKVLTAGDIGAIGKMDKVKTGDTLCDPKKVEALEPIVYAPACYSQAIAPKVKGQEEKIAAGLGRLNEEDPSFSLVNNAETHQLVISGTGDQQLDVLVAKLKSRFGVDAELSPAKVAFREKIKKTVQAHGRHKKQTGGSGQFGDVWVRFEPQDEQDDLIFDVEVVGGAVPKNFNPAVEKGIQEAIQKGPLAGYPMVGLKAVLYDGSYHPVDSNEMAFKLAAILAFKEAMPNAMPTLLEPVGALAVTVPEDYVGDVMGDLSKRRGRPMGMNPDSDGNTVVEAEVPMAEMSSYAIDLRAMTQARGSFTLEFVRYEEVPKANQQKIIDDAKKNEE
ncbi:MAG: elongation factor G [Ruminococcaceae bacterium]|nr:elongation factor G [Oscillospiraceae bacterium]